MRIRKAFHRVIRKLSSPETNPFYYILLPFLLEFRVKNFNIFSTKISRQYILRNCPNSLEMKFLWNWNKIGRKKKKWSWKDHLYRWIKFFSFNVKIFLSFLFPTPLVHHKFWTCYTRFSFELNFVSIATTPTIVFDFRSRNKEGLLTSVSNNFR